MARKSHVQKTQMLSFHFCEMGVQRWEMKKYSVRNLALISDRDFS